MNKKFLFCAVLFLVSFFTSYSLAVWGSEEGPLIVVVIMVKNEEAVIKRTLKMYCEADPEGLKLGYLVYDTGDDAWSPTMQKAKELFDEYHLSNYVILQEPFIDFATSRNKALRYAEEKFPHAHFLLMPDAEWYLNNVPALLEFCEEHCDGENYNSYLIRILSTNLDFYIPRLIRAHSNAYFEGVVHEVINDDRRGTLKVPENVYFEYPEHPAGLEVSKKRWLRDRNLLLKEYLRNPNNPRNTFYLAQTYDCLGDLENAYFYYQKRSQLKGFEEEDYMAHYRLGHVSERMINAEGTIDWFRALRHYLDAHIVRPTRAEPLVRIAVYYINRSIYDLAFMYAYLACQIGYPADVLFVEKEFYDRVRYETFAKAAMHVRLEIPGTVCKEAFNRNAKDVPLEKFILSQVFPA